MTSCVPERIVTKKKPRRLLLALDFDNTLISHDSSCQISVQPLFPDRVIPLHLQRLKREKGWDAFVPAVFDELHRLDVSPDAILAALGAQKLVDGMAQVLTDVSDAGGEIIIISDSFELNVQQVLVAHQLDATVQRIYANEAEFRFKKLTFSKSSNKSQSCKLSRRAICKGQKLQEFIQDRSQQGVHFNQVVFAGDGRNDLCVALSLHRDDIVLARRGYELDRILAEAGTLTQADHVAWSNGFDILKTLRRKEIL